LEIKKMKCLIDLTIVPIGVGVSLSKYVAACERVLDRPGLTTSLHPNGTSIEGEWEDVFDAVRSCHDAVHEMGAPRIHTVIKLSTRTDREQTMQDKLDSVHAKLASD
jgi:uncharacterized protein (TIGR00106 family)